MKVEKKRSPAPEITSDDIEEQLRGLESRQALEAEVEGKRRERAEARLEGRRRAEARVRQEKEDAVANAGLWAWIAEETE